MSTVKASFGGWIPLVNLDKGTPIPLCFVFQLPDKFTPTHIRDGFCQAVVFDHILDVFFDQDADKVASGCIFGDGDTGGFDPFGQGARPVDIKRSIHLGKSKLFPVPLEGRRHIRSGLRPVFLVELGILGTSFKEITESSIKVTQGLLKRNAGNFVEPGCLFFEEG